MDDGEHTRVQERRMASTRMVVEAAIDFSNGANREMWETYRWRMSDNISPWRTGGFIIEEQATSEFAAESEPATTYKRASATSAMESEPAETYKSEPTGSD